MVNLELVNELELEDFIGYLNNIDNYYLNLIYNPLLKEVQERYIYEKTSSLINWNCAICGCDILLDKNRNDVENFVCESCRDVYNNENINVDGRILLSRNKMYKYIEDKLYEELEDNLKGGV